MPSSSHKARQHVVELLPRQLVERGEGLVEQENGGPRDERARERDAHLHAARELGGVTRGRVGEADLRERGAGPFAALALGTPRSSSGSATLSSTSRHGKRCAS